jgi:predicted PurR-regulated permease PerM
VASDTSASSSLQSAAANVQPDSVVSAFGAITHTLLGVGLTLFLLFYFLKDREGFFQWLHARMPVPDDTQSEFYDELDHILKAVLLGHVLVALVQGVLAGLGLIATGIPNATFWTVVMTVLSLLPIVGSFLVWGPAAAFLFANGQTALAVGLFLWGTVVVGVSDDYLRPIVVDRYAKVNPSVVILGVLGGIYVVGFMGIFYGPVVIGMLRATADVFAGEFAVSEMD